ncbi:ribokinase [Aneurinibacillus tyrosinisolvens]|uniref:ribokinase n=1 Tax=Aneurinibacillus tyrosinisolvens TaxID=1443435 RepID=UPI00063F33EC|nr:ribokinase [Aneurinibacillus tyrosinisolvens]
MKKSKVTVIGSINMDLVTETPRVPAIGETVLGRNFSTFPGGKGANQAVACARLGAEVTMVGCVGDDGFGRELVHYLLTEHILMDYVEPVTHTATGIASITVQDGDNSIVVVPGANHELTVKKVAALETIIQHSDIVLLQLEIPLETVEAAANIAHKHGVPVVLNPAPAVRLPENLLDKVSFITPNEHELAIMAGAEGEQAEDYCSLMQRYPGKVVMTKGSEGAYYVLPDGSVGHEPGRKVEVMDTTGAGDTFNGALAVMLAEGKSLEEATKYAVAASALSVTRFGAQSGMPTKDQVDNFIQQMERSI